MSQTLTLTEAARRLGVSRTKVWSMVRAGELVAYADPLDKRQRLIPQVAIDELLVRRGLPPRPRARTIGLVDDGTVQSDQVEDYIREHWQPE